jgi:hypothetical protein
MPPTLATYNPVEDIGSIDVCMVDPTTSIRDVKCRYVEPRGFCGWNGIDLGKIGLARNCELERSYARLNQLTGC